MTNTFIFWSFFGKITVVTSPSGQVRLDKELNLKAINIQPIRAVVLKQRVANDGVLNSRGNISASNS